MKFKSFISYLIITFIFITGSILTSNAQVTNWTNYNNRNSNNTYLIINSKKNKMAYYKDNKFVREFDVATGKKTTPTPPGKFKIVNKIVNRPYYSGGIDGGDPRNPLGDRWLGLYVNGTYGTNYGIHGNNNESSIGNHVSGGCIRMHNAEIRWLFDQIEIGSEAIIKYTDDSYEDIAKSYNIELTGFKHGWILENGMYYLYQDGKIVTGWNWIDNAWYYLGTDGKMSTGWNWIDNAWYYLGTDGKMTTEWNWIDDTWYYLGIDGKMVTNTNIDGWNIGLDGRAYLY